MMRRAFTLVELMVAASISAIILASLSAALMSVWKVATRTNEELEILFKASAARERLLVGTAKPGKSGFHGLLNVTNTVKSTDSGRRLVIYKADQKTEDKNERLQGNTVAWTFGRGKACDKYGVAVSNLGTFTNEFDYAEIRQRVTIYLWVTNTAGTVCRMPVYLTTVRDAPKEAE